MRLPILFLALLSGLLLALTPPAQAAPKKRAAPKAAAADSGELPPVNWNLVSKGFIILFRDRTREIAGAEPNRFFPATATFAMIKIDTSGHFLMLKCFSAAQNCDAKRDMLEDRMMFATLLEVLRTPKVSKDALYNERTWEVTTLGYKYIEMLRKRYPDLPSRLGRMVGAAFA